MLQKPSPNDFRLNEIFIQQTHETIPFYFLFRVRVCLGRLHLFTEGSMRKSFLTGILLLTASVLIPSCVEGSDEPSVDDQSVINTENDPMADDESASSRLRDATGVTATRPNSITNVAAQWDCTDGRLCLWAEPNFQGYKVDIAGTGKCQPLGGFGMNNDAASWFNRSGAQWTLYREGNCLGAKFPAPGWTNAGQMDPYWNNDISAVCRGSTCP